MSLLDQVHVSSIIMEGKDGSTVASSSMEDNDAAKVSAGGSTADKPAKRKRKPLTMTGALSQL